MACCGEKRVPAAGHPSVHPLVIALSTEGFRVTLPAVPAVPSRRAVVRTALWSVPAISLATAAPAFADSTQPALEFVAGDTGVDWNGNLVLEGASVHAAGRSIAPAPVT